ncbi:MAG TPA: polysaccharide pyruvyl transferase family protein [Patescibacteria group bacterium]|nr:polysaccharide pyruvyl transferase family protein [Patescibacteria group bacterium]
MLIKKLYTRYRKPLKLYWWRYNHPNKLNFGDELTPRIIESLFGRRCIWSPPDECDIAGAGSIIEILLEQKAQNKPLLWGSGFIKKGLQTISLNDFNILAVRGASTLGRVMDSSRNTIALGDPGLLTSYLLDSQPRKKYRLGIVPHYVDLDSHVINELSKQKGVKIISPLDPPIDVVRSIAMCESVISSSLHGLIVADSVGTPNAHLKLSDGLTGGLYKFNDYYSVFSDPSRYISLHPGDVLGKQPEIIVQNIEQLYRSPADIDSLKQDLIKSFPSVRF